MTSQQIQYGHIENRFFGYISTIYPPIYAKFGKKHYVQIQVTWPKYQISKTQYGGRPPFKKVVSLYLSQESSFLFSCPFLAEPLPFVRRCTFRCDKPWVTSEFRQLIKRRQRAFLPLYRKLRNQTKRMAASLREKYFQNKIESLHSLDPHTWWTKIKNFLQFPDSTPPPEPTRLSVWWMPNYYRVNQLFCWHFCRPSWTRQQYAVWSRSRLQVWICHRPFRSRHSSFQD